MAGFDLLVRGGRVMTASGLAEVDIGVRAGRIVELAPQLSGAAEVIDAADRLVLPGGVDVHCHIEQKTSLGITTADDFYTATVGAAFGGTTTVVPFAAQHRGDSLRAVIEEYRRRADGRAVVDYAFHVIVTDPTPSVLNQELPALADEGFTSVKIYMTYDALRLNDRQILDVLVTARRDGLMVMVHAESHDLIGWLVDRMLGGGYAALKYFPHARAEATEREATHRAIAMAELIDVPIYLVHVSSGEAVEQIRWARNRGLRVHAETCPQYLLLTAAELDRPAFEGAKYCCSPPLRDAASQAALWRACADGLFDVVSSDHSAFRFDDPKGKRLHGTDAPFSKVPYGLPGLEARLPLMFSEGVARGRLSLEQFVALTATNPSRLFGLYPRKGVIAEGSDADLVIWNPLRSSQLSAATLHDGMDYTPYEGLTVTAAPEVTIVRGRVVCRNGKLEASAGYGLWQACDRPPAAAPVGTADRPWLSLPEPWFTRKADLVD